VAGGKRVAVDVAAPVAPHLTLTHVSFVGFLLAGLYAS